MNCDALKDCAEKNGSETSCLEIVTELNGYRYALEIWRDCFMYMLKTDDSNLTRQEMETTMSHKVNCALVQYRKQFERLQEGQFINDVMDCSFYSLFLIGPIMREG